MVILTESEWTLDPFHPSKVPSPLTQCYMLMVTSRTPAFRRYVQMDLYIKFHILIQSSRMHTARSSSHLLGGGVCLSACWDTLPPWVLAWTPPQPRPVPGHYLGQTPQPPPGSEPRPPPPGQTPQPPPGPGPGPRHPPCEQNGRQV